VYSVLLRRKPAAMSPLVFLAATMAAGLLVLMPFWAFELARGARIPTDMASIGAGRLHRPLRVAVRVHSLEPLRRDAWGQR